VAADRIHEHFEGGAVEQILAGVNLVSDIDADGVERIEDRSPAASELGESGLDQARAASISCSTAQACRSAGLPCTAAGAKASKAVS
jgi:hypothetical protein